MIEILIGILIFILTPFLSLLVIFTKKPYIGNNIEYHLSIIAFFLDAIAYLLLSLFLRKKTSNKYMKIVIIIVLICYLIFHILLNFLLMALSFGTPVELLNDM